MVTMNESERDEPIYVMCHSLRPVKMFWYVIEDKERPHIHKPKRKRKTFFVDEKLSDDGNIEVLCESETDRIRSLRLPNLSNSHIIGNTEFFVLNSFLYMLGGHDLNQYRHPVKPDHKLVRFCDLNLQNKGWQIAGSFDTELSGPTAVTCFDKGSIFIESYYDAFLLNYSPKSNQFDMNYIRIPSPPISSRLDCGDKNLLALKDNDVIWSMSSRCDMFGSRYCRYGVCFNLSTEKYHGIHNDNESFNGHWSKGVVLYDSYLLTFGTIHSDKEDPSLRVYDLNTRKWLPDRNDYGMFDKKKVLPRPDYQNHIIEFFLLQVGDNKLALVWYEYTTKYQAHPRNIIHCTKFTIHKTSDANDTLVYPKVVSHGTYRVDGVLLKAAARVTVREDDERNSDQGRAKDQCYKIVEQDSSVNHTKGKENERRGRLLLGRKCKKPKI